MLKMVVNVVLSGFVLASGLVSCAPDGNKNVVKDVYVAKPPKIQRATGEVFLTSQDQSRIGSLDLRDTFDFTESAPVTVVITSKCGPDKLISKNSFTGKHKIAIYQVIDPQTATRDLKTEVVDCSFKADLYNTAGSNHVFDIDSLRLTDVNPSKMTIERSGKIENKITVGQLNDLNLRFTDGVTADASVQCVDVTFESVRFTSVVSMNAFNWARPKVRNKDTPNAYKARSFQLCRILLTRNGELLDVSEPLRIVFPLQPLTASLVPSDYDYRSPARPGQTFAMHKIRFTNPEGVARTVRYITRRHNVHTETYMYGTTIVSHIGPNYGFVGAIRWEEADGRAIEFIVPPNGHIDVPVNVKFNNEHKCTNDSYGFTLQIRDVLTFVPMDSADQAEAPINVGPLPGIWAAKRHDLNPATYKPGPNKNSYSGVICWWG